MDRFTHRERLLSLKYSTIEACFSVPMLNLTLPSFPFVLAFTVKGLGWTAGAVGAMAALTHICNFLQPLLIAGLSRRFSPFGLLMVTFSIGGVAWLFAPLLQFLGNQGQDALFIAILLSATLSSSVATVAWSSAISEVVPERLTARYYARRNLIFGAWTLIIVWCAGRTAQSLGNTLTVFGFIFLAAGLGRLAALFFLRRMKFPESVHQPRPKGIALEDLWKVVRDRNYLWLCLFVGLWGFSLNFGMPFYTVFLVGQLKYGVGDVVMFTTLSSLGGLLTLKSWGRLCERFGNRPVMQVAASIWAVSALINWSLARPGWTWHLYLGYGVAGAMTAGFQLAQFNLMVRLAPAALRPAYVAIFISMTSFLTAMGPLLGGQVLRFLPFEIAAPGGIPISSYHLVFACSAVACIAVTAAIRRVREPAEAPTETVWREMSTMRTFNPMLSILAVGELLLTPRGLFALGQRSLRTVRQQVRAIEGVGSEFIDGGRQALENLKRRDDPKQP